MTKLLFPGDPILDSAFGNFTEICRIHQPLGDFDWGFPLEGFRPLCEGPPPLP